MDLGIPAATLSSATWTAGGTVTAVDDGDVGNKTFGTIVAGASGDQQDVKVAAVFSNGAKETFVITVRIQ